MIILLGLTTLFLGSCSSDSSEVQSNNVTTDSTLTVVDTVK